MRRRGAGARARAASLGTAHQMPRKPTIQKSTKRMRRTTHSTPKVVRKVTEHHHTPIFIHSGQIWIMHSTSAPRSMPAHIR